MLDVVRKNERRRVSDTSGQMKVYSGGQHEQVDSLTKFESTCSLNQKKQESQRGMKVEEL